VVVCRELVNTCIPRTQRRKDSLEDLVMDGGRRNVILSLKFEGVVPERGGIRNRWSEHQLVRNGAKYGLAGKGGRAELWLQYKVIYC
jgi:hypothetical protein